MPMIELQMQDYDAIFAYVPPVRSVVVNSEDISTVVAVESPGSGPWARVTMRSGKSMVVRGTPLEIMTKCLPGGA